MIPRDWLFLLPGYDKNKILYAPLHKKAVRITEKAANNITPILLGKSPKSDFHKEIYNTLDENDLLIPPNINQKSEIRGNKIYLSITNKCNLRCIYCYANSGHNNSSMSFGTAKSALDYQLTNILKAGEETIAVTFH